MKKVWLLLLILFIITFLSLNLGGVKLNLLALSIQESFILYQIRAPRILCSIFAGGILALCGLILQCVFQNPMTDSYVLGISSGSVFFISLASFLGFQMCTSITSFLGSLTVSVILFTTSNENKTKLLLSGVSINFLLSALATLLIYLGPRSMEKILFWTMGSLASSTWNACLLLGVTCILMIIILMVHSSRMDILTLDDSTALSNGVDVLRERRLLLLLAAFGCAVVTSTSGIIGFIGLMSPHYAKTLVGSKHTNLISSSILVGAIILLISDSIARSILAPTELPVGIITSIIGAPFMLAKLNRKYI